MWLLRDRLTDSMLVWVGVARGRMGFYTAASSKSPINPKLQVERKVFGEKEAPLAYERLKSDQMIDY